MKDELILYCSCEELVNCQDMIFKTGVMWFGGGQEYILNREGDYKFIFYIYNNLLSFSTRPNTKALGNATHYKTYFREKKLKRICNQ